MRKLNAIKASVLMLMLALSCSAKNLGNQDSVAPKPLDQKQILEQCREAVLELKYKREIEAQLRKEVEELKKVNSNQADRVAHLEAAIAKYESAITARQQAEVLVSELRRNYEGQLQVVEKQLAVEQQRTHFWKTLAKIGVVTGLVVGAVVGYAANK